jgi:hypothetical protein
MIRLLFSVGDGGQTAKTFHSIDLPDEKAKLLLQSTAVVIGFENCREINLKTSLGYAEQIALWEKTAKELRELAAIRPGGFSATWKNDGNVDGGIPIPPNVAAEIENVFKDSERPDVVYTPGEPEIPCNGSENVQRQQIPASADMGLGATAMDYRNLYERKEIQPAAVKSHPDGYFIIDDPAQKGDHSPEKVGEFIADTITDRLKQSREESGEQPGIIYGQGLKTKLWLMLRANGEFVKSTTEEGGESYIACTSEQEARKVAEQQKIYDIDCVPHRVF